MKVIKVADKVIVIDKFSYNTLKKSGFTKIQLIPNFLSPEVNDIINDSNITRKRRTILFVGHVVLNKGVFELVEACKSIENINLILAGHVSLENKERIKSIVNGDTNWIEITGEISYSQVIKQMLSCDVFCLPTYTEGFPNVVIEAMACGCSIIASGVGAIPEMLEKENNDSFGIIIRPHDTDDLRCSILEMFNNEEFKISCGLNAKKRINDRYSVDKVWSKLCDVWQSTNVSKL